ncbi:MGH1-like glycoside hydrolase domain-containing protein [Rhizobium leguminosarum]|uniref:MGH1-like glycoside hydrolase domain-containing protein n=1 Tax=Rhizobium leguminosarum TaxID=384 RepID=UPI00143F857D|nr:trehalase family glycosidase [Rhizobium leguminosarum]NKK67383.1 glycoside hydrolase family 37 [Rhizobium leguminosarum bv. viciae]NKL03408.1 glycoside hydrolase family 37 [Rhizobium leguminosarum bv. viciae]NKL82649.1 glycoside hydrolase family 37 [Rhizobium leguminosarum bv. viciae]NKM93440.1 glycoside hydrolase family 37 [Rhizobium leguminosarum bv. viciae]
MLQHSTIPLMRAWNSWSSRPAEMVFLPLGVRITPVLYSTRSRTTSAIEPRRDMVRLGRHAIDGSLIELETDLSGTTVAFSTTKTDPFAIRGSWSGKISAEWGLRFWLTLAISAEGGEVAVHDADRNITLLKVGSRFVAVATAEAPVQVTGHDTIDALRTDFEENGYFYTASRKNEAPVIALRFNLEMMRQGAYAAAVADSAELAIAKAKVCLAAGAPAEIADVQTGLFGGALDAMRDVVAWNTIWDETNARSYTAVTRIWNLGKFAVWFNDQIFAALLAGVFDADLARENMATALAGATPQGNIACIVTSNDAWVDRSQLPFGALVVWQLYQRTGERSMIQASYEALVRNRRWWQDNRDPDGFGLLSCGTSDVGEGLYKGTAFAARNETGMDNSATHDEAIYDPVTRTLSTFDVGLNCAAALDAEMLSKMAAELGRHEDAGEFAALAERHRVLISETLWDDSRGIFANRQRRGAFVRSLSPTSFYPMLCGAATPAQAARLLEHLNDEATFGGDFVLPNATRDDPAFADNVYWRGRIWPNVNYMVWLGLRRYGFVAEASKLARQSYDLFMKNWREDRIASENYNAITGEAMDQGDTDPFYIWAAMLPLMAASEIVDFDPWAGWTICNTGQNVALGPMVSPSGTLELTVKSGTLVMTLNGHAALKTDLLTTLSRIVFADGRVACTIAPVAEGGYIELPGLALGDVLAARINGQDVNYSSGDDGIRVMIAGHAEDRRLDVYFSSSSAH